MRLVCQPNHLLMLPSANQGKGNNLFQILGSNLIYTENKMQEKLTNKFEVSIYYSSYCTYAVDAKNKTEAILKARKLGINENEILANLETWVDADSAEPVF
jgi:hypothetical protein